MLFVAVSPEEGVFDLVWLVPSTDLAKAATVNSESRRRFVASAKANSQDQWSGYRCCRQDFAGRILEVIDGLA